jgi:hypothetical protein
MKQTLSIAETRDASLVWQIASAPEVFERVTNDAWNALGRHVQRTHVDILVANPKNHILLVLDAGVPVGCFALDGKGDGLFEVHTMLLKSCRGANAIAAGKRAIEFAMRIEGVEKLVSYCPTTNPESYWYARICGFHRAGVAAFQWVKHGISYPIRIVELSKKEFAACH